MAGRTIKCRFHIIAQINEDDYKRILETAQNGGKYVEMNFSATALIENVNSTARPNYIDADANIVAVNEPKITIE